MIAGSEFHLLSRQNVTPAAPAHVGTFDEPTHKDRDDVGIGASSGEARETRGSLFPNRPAAMNPSLPGNGALSGDEPIPLWKWGSVRGAAGDARLIFPGAARGRERPVWAMEHSDK
jgi:hypothetical protein